MTKQEENWELMTLLQMPWFEANRVEDPEDRQFLLEKAEQVKKHITEQQKMQEDMMKQQQESGGQIITPADNPFK